MSVGRNDPCPCGSGSKFKRCCAGADAARPARATALLRQAQEGLLANRLSDAERLCRQLLLLVPAHGRACHILGVVAQRQGRPAQAMEWLAKAFASVDSPSATLYLHRAAAAQDMGQDQLAAADLQQALALSPTLADAHFRLGLIREQQGEHATAAVHFRQAAVLPGATLHAWIRLGAVLFAMGDTVAALEAIAEARARKPRTADTISNLVLTFIKFGVPERAVDFLEELLAESGGPMADPGLRANVLSLLGESQKRCGRIEAAVDSLRAAVALRPDSPMLYSNLLFTLQYLPGYGAAALLADHREYASRFEAPLLAQWAPHANDRSPARRLRVGYVSADFHDHVVAALFEPVLARHDPARLEVFCYSCGASVDAVTRRLMALAEHWRPAFALSDAALAGQIRADAIDILVDLAGHTGDNRLPVFARKPAPVQVSWLGYPGTTGLAAIDYRLSDAGLDPEGVDASCYTETLLRLPSWTAFTGPADAPEPNPLPALTGSGLTLASLNNLAKLNDAVIGLWAEVLAALPGARLLVGSAGEEATQERLRQRFASAGVQPERLEFLPRLPRAEFLLLHHRIDLALDPFPYTGGVTCLESLWMGVPVLTLAGETTVSRQSAGFLRGVGLDQFVAVSAQDYVERARAIASDLPALAAIRQQLRGRLATAADATELARALERAYAGMWQTWCAGRT